MPHSLLNPDPFTPPAHNCAAISFNSTKGAAVAIASQEDAAVWIGEFDWKVRGFPRGPLHTLVGAAGVVPLCASAARVHSGNADEGNAALLH